MYSKNSVLFIKSRVFKNSGLFKRPSFSETPSFLPKDGVFKFRAFFQNFRVFSKIPCFFSKLPCFFKNSVLFKNSPFETPSIHKKDGVFIKSRFFNKIHFVNINIWISLILYGTFDILYPI